jgi:hypothetical protein
VAAVIDTEGVPEIAQLALSIESPAGRVGADVQVVGVVPVSVGLIVVMTLPFEKLNGLPA